MILRSIVIPTTGADLPHGTEHATMLGKRELEASPNRSPDKIRKKSMF